MVFCLMQPKGSPCGSLFLLGVNMNIEGWNSGSVAQDPVVCEHIKQIINNLITLDVTFTAVGSNIEIRCGRCRSVTKPRHVFP